MTTTAAEYLPPAQEAATTTASSGGWFRAMRNPEALELIQVNPCAFVLAYVIAYRGQYRDGFNRHNLALGEALLGDHLSYGMSEQQYRTAKNQLKKWHFATFKPTNKGTVGKLIDSRLFSIFRLESNEQDNTRVTDKQRTGNGRVTTTKNLRTEEQKELKGEAPRRRTLNASERISAEKEREEIEAELKKMRDQASEDAFGPKFNEVERARRKELKERDRLLAEALRVQL